LRSWWSGFAERSYPDKFRESVVTLEFERRVAAAAIETARYTRNSARYMLWSVIAIAASSVVATVVSWLR
jgi:hypothetical protein